MAAGVGIAAIRAGCDESQSPRIERPDLIRSCFGRFLICEIFPLEADFTYMFVWQRMVLPFVAVKAVFLLIILLPMIRYFRLNGRKGFRAAPWRISSIGVLILARLILDIVVFQPGR